MNSRKKPPGAAREKGGRRRSSPNLTRSDFEEVAFPYQASSVRSFEHLTLEWFHGPDLDQLLARRHGSSANSFLSLKVTPEELLALSTQIFSVLAKLGPTLNEVDGPQGRQPGAVLVPLAVVALVSAIMPLHNLAYFAGYGADPLAMAKDLKRRSASLERAAGRPAKAARRGQEAG